MNQRPQLHQKLAGLACASLTALALWAAAPATAQARGASVAVNVEVVAGELRVSTENTTMPANVSTISWQIKTPGWRFQPGSIDFGDAAGAFSCRVFNEGAAISCNRSSRAPEGELPYRIRLSNGGALMLPPQPLVYISLE